MQLIAMITMLIDHVGLIFFPGELVWRAIGRMAFPIYAYALVQGYHHTSNNRKYLLRLLLIAALSQIPYQIAFDTYNLNIVATLLVSILTLHLLDIVKPGFLSIIIVTAVGVFMEWIPFDYGAYGLILVLIFRYAAPKEKVVLHFLLNLVYLFTSGWVLQGLSVIPTIVMAYLPDWWKKTEGWRMPRLVWRSFYPLHLAILAILVYFLGND